MKINEKVIFILLNESFFMGRVRLEKSTLWNVKLLRNATKGRREKESNDCYGS